MPTTGTAVKYHSRQSAHDSEHIGAQTRPFCGIYVITLAAQFPLRLIPPLPRVPSQQPFYKSGKLEQIRYPQERAPPTHDDLWIRSRQLCPLGRHTADGPLINLEQQTLALTVLSPAHTGQPLSALGMERVCDQYKVHPCTWSTCIPN